MIPKSILCASALSLVVLAPAAVQAQDDGVRNILVYGDSITWGWFPRDPIVPTVRHAEADRWPTILEAVLGDGYNVITEGLSGRTTNMDDPTQPGLLDGADTLDSIVFSHEPLDLVVIMLGTNDTKTYLERTPLEIGLGMGELINIVQEGPNNGWYEYDRPDVLVISPPPLGAEVDPGAAEAFEGGQDILDELPAVYSGIADAAGAHFFDAATVVTIDNVGVDGIHLTVEGNRNLAEGVAPLVREILE